MATQLRLALASLCLCLPALGVTVTYGVAVPGVTAAAVNGSTDVVVSNAAQFEGDHMVIAIAGVGGLRRILDVAGNTLKLDAAVDATVAGAAIRIVVDGFDHAAGRFWITTDVPVCASMWFDVAPHGAGPEYRYRSGETTFGTVTAVAVVGLKPDTYYYLRANVKTVYGNDNSTACNTDACGATELILQTMPDSHSSNGRPPMPNLPEPVDARVLTAPDTSGYAVYPVPGFADGLVTGSIAGGGTQLTVNAVPAGLTAGQWIVIAGAACVGNSGSPAPPWCKIQSIAGNTLTLAQPVSASASGAAVTWAMYNVYDAMLNGNQRYGTVFEWAQGYDGIWYPSDFGNGTGGMKIHGLPRDSNGACAATPCAMDDPAHRWLVFRTKATPGLLPPPGVRTGPEFAGLLGGFGRGGIYLSGDDQNPVHHVRFENLEFTSPPEDPNAADPPPPGNPVLFPSGAGTQMPQYVAFDRLYLHTPDDNSRTRGFFGFFSGKHVTLVNSYLKGDYWRPYKFHFGPDLATAGDIVFNGNTIAISGVQWWKNKFQPMASQGAATITASGTASADVLIVGYLPTNVASGVAVRYSSGKGVVVSCPACASVTAVAAPAAPPTGKVVLQGIIPQGQTTIACDTYCNGNVVGGMTDSAWTSEGAIGVYPSDGDHWLFENNYFEVYGTGQWYIDIPSSLIAKSPHDIVIRRNRFFWSQSRRLSSPESNGFWYQVRHNAIEVKRGSRYLIEGNEASGGWARINHGTAITYSNTASQYNQPIVTGIADMTLRYNLFYTQSESFGGGGHEFNNRLMGRDTARLYFGHNLVYGQNAFVQNEQPSPGFFGRQGIFGGHDLIVEHNTWFDGRSNMPTFFNAGEDRGEGMWFQNNMWHLNKDGFYGMLIQKVDNGTMLMQPPTAEGVAFDLGLRSIWVRLAEAAVPNFTFSHNLITCGVVAHSATDVTDMPQAECDLYKAKFGSLANVNYFPAGDGRQSREQSVKWVDADRKIFRLSPGSPYASGGQKSSDGLDIGVNTGELRRRLGTIEDVLAQNIKSDEATIHARVPDVRTWCAVAYGKDSSPALWTVGTPDTNGGTDRLLRLTGLEAGATYNYQVWCTGAPRTVTYQFTTST